MFEVEVNDKVMLYELLRRQWYVGTVTEVRLGEGGARTGYVIAERDNNMTVHTDTDGKQRLADGQLPPVSVYFEARIPTEAQASEIRVHDKLDVLDAQWATFRNGNPTEAQVDALALAIIDL